MATYKRRTVCDKFTTFYETQAPKHYSNAAKCEFYLTFGAGKNKL